MKSHSTFRPHALLSFPFFALGLVSFLTLAGWLALNPALLFGAERGPQALTFAHVTILGWLLPCVFGAAYQLIPVIAETRLRSRGLAYAHLAMHFVAAPRLFAAMLDGDFASAGRWGALVALGVVVGIANLLVTAGHRSRWTPENIGLLFALFWLLTTVGLGVALASARVGSPSEVLLIPAERVLRVHTLCGLVGFFLTTLVAVSFRLVPMFLLSRVPTRSRAWAAVALLHGGMLLLTPAVLFGWNAVIGLGTVALGAGVACFLAEITVLVRHRLRPLDWPLRSYLIGIAMLAPVTVIGILGGLAAAGVDWPSPARPALLVFVLGVFGVLTPAILGMAGKIVPFLAWQWKFADRLGRAPVPLVSALFHAGLLRTQFALLLPAMVALTGGVALESLLVIRAAAVTLLAAGGLLAANVAYLVRFIAQQKESAERVGPSPTLPTATAPGSVS
jgi:hypothetical protein